MNHDTLVGKLNKYGIKGYMLVRFHSYLSIRTQLVKVNDEMSEIKNVL